MESATKARLTINELSHQDSSYEVAMEIARASMQKYRKVGIELAK